MIGIGITVANPRKNRRKHWQSVALALDKQLKAANGETRQALNARVKEQNKTIKELADSYEKLAIEHKKAIDKIAELEKEE